MGSGDGALDKRITGTHERLQEIARRRKTLRWLKLATPIAAILIVLGGVWAIWSTMRTNVVDRKDELATAFQDRASHTNLADRIQRDAKAAADRVIPVVQDELAKAQAKLGSTLPDALASASKDLEPRVKTHMEEALNGALADVRVRQREALMATFGPYIDCKPGEAAEICAGKRARADKLLEDITTEYHDVAIVQTTLALNAHLNALGDIHDAVAGLAARDPAAAATAQKSASSGAAPTDMLMIFMEAVGDSLGGGTDAFGGAGPEVEEPELEPAPVETDVRQTGQAVPPAEPAAPAAPPAEPAAPPAEPAAPPAEPAAPAPPPAQPAAPTDPKGVTP